MTPTEINQNGPYEVDIQEGHLDLQSCSRILTLRRSDDKPGFGFMCGGEEQAQHTWQEKLEQECRDSQINLPEYKEFSERRGGHMVWSMRITVSGKHIFSRGRYGHQYLDDAKEDAAEEAWKFLTK